MSELSLIRASAGSGKTYSLTLKYLELLFKYENNYKKILAVTFTNKATEEMKSRIISQLSKLANGEKSDYENYLIKKYKFTSDALKQKAKSVLSKILHDYSKFSVLTIDSFFQNILKSFAKEINLQFGFTIELDSELVLKEVVEKVLNEISSNKILKKWIIDYVKGKINSEGKVDIKKEILNLGKEIFKEVFVNFNQNKIDKKILDEFLIELKKIKAKFEIEISKIAKDALDYVKKNGLETSDFKGGEKGFIFHFKKILNKKFEYTNTVLKVIDNEQGWYTKKSDKINLIIGAYPVLNNHLKQAVDYYDKNFEVYNSIDISLKHFFTLGIVSDILKKLYEHTNENNIFLISDTSKFINLIIDNNDVPFIYEKIGSIFKFYMIDEFQDTSELQWDNFKPLIDNSLANNNDNLIVGDIKQSIYRWRNGNWELLANKVKSDLSIYNVNQISLDTNWRSCENVVKFNNSIFEHYSTMLQQKFNDESLINDSTIQDAYFDVNQKVSPNNLDRKIKGYVYTEFIEAEKTDEYKNAVLDKLPNIIENLQDNNYALRDIAIIVRTKSEGEKIANYLLDYKNSDNAKKDYKYDVVSNEALLIKNSNAIRLIISVLKFLLNKNDLINRAEIIYLYNSFFNNNNSNLSDLLIKSSNIDEFYKLIPKQFKEKESEILHLPLFEMTNKITQVFDINNHKNSLPFIIAFNDFVTNFLSKNDTDLFSFLEYWDENIDKVKISSSENQNAIKIITIHKSKGLQFPAVIMPFVNWTVEYESFQQPIMWCKSDVKPFDMLDFIPIKYSNNLQKSIFKNYYNTEKLRTYIDNLNLLYVGFTRAESSLFVFSIKPSEKKQQTNNISKINDGFYYILNNYFVNNKSQENDNVFEIGKLEKLNAKTSNYKYKSIEISKSINSLNNDRLRIRNSENNIFDENKLSSIGVIYHKIFENILSESDVKKVVNKLVIKGVIKKEKIDFIINEILDFINSSPESKSWFNNNENVIVEQNIISLNKNIKRPDRIVFKKDKIIVIDYKFWNIEKTDYISQVKNYVDLMIDMGYKNVLGKVWYVNKNKIVNTYK